MKILICSDGMPSSDNAARLTGLLIGQCQAAITLLGIAEQSRDEQPLRAALDKEAESLRAHGLNVEIVWRGGDPIQPFVQFTATDKFDRSVIGTRGKGPSGLYLRSAKTYEAG